MSALLRRKTDKLQPETDLSRLGKSITIRGILDSDGEIFVQGNVLGKIKADRLILGFGGYIEGDIVARDVVIGGRLNGRVFALNVTLDSSADITGRIFHHTVTVAKGAKLDGRMPWRPVNYFESLDKLAEALPA